MKRIFFYIKKLLFALGTIIAIVLSGIATLLHFSFGWILNTWNNLTMDELLYHLSTPLEGTNEGMFKEYFDVCVAPTILILLFVIIILVYYRRHNKYFLVMGIGIVLPLAVSGISFWNMWNQLDVGSYVKSQGMYSTFIDNYYIDPIDIEMKFPERKRNLIYIFLESMETTYADKENGGAFKKNVIPELTQLAHENEDFSGEDSKLNGGYAMHGTTWTMAAMFSQTSGLPLNLTIDGNSMDTQDSFFSNVVTLGDLLEQAGYSQNLMIGSNATFGGRKLYFTEHGNYNILDYNYAMETGMIPEDYRVWWGYEDKKLFKFAKKKILELAEQEAPFNFTLLTVDTHFEDGYSCDICPDIFGDNQYANVMKCSSSQVNEFVEWIKQQDFYKDTAIVLVGDHPTMDSDFCESVNSSYVRKVYTAYINSAIEVESSEKRNYTTFDIFPTTLAALGVKIKGDRLGLGTNLFSSIPTLTERFGVATEEKELSKRSKLMESLANLDENKEELVSKQNESPTANVWADTYKFEYGNLPVKVTDISEMQGGIEKVMIAVWTQEDQSDLQWIQMEVNDEGSYFANVNVPSFNYAVGQYYIDAYVIDGLGKQYLVGKTIGLVE